MLDKRVAISVWILALALLMGCSGNKNASGTPEPGLQNPIAQLVPTNTPYPTYTPYPTLTPYPTYTPLPTSTPMPTPTPIRLCNPYWNDVDAVPVNVSGAPDQASKILQNEIKRATAMVSLPSGQNWVQIYLTFLSPQIAEAIVTQQAATEFLTPKQSRDLLFNFDRNLERRNALAFLMMIRGRTDATINVYFGPLEKSLTFTNQRSQEFRPLEQSSPVLASVINMANGGAEGYVLVPRAASDRCNPTFDVLNDNLLNVRASNIALWKSSAPVGSPGSIFDSFQLPFTTPNSYRVGALWSFGFAAGKSLVDVMNTPAPRQSNTELDSKTVADIAALAVKVFKQVR